MSTRALEDAARGKVSRGVFQKIMAGEYDAKIGQRIIDGLAEALQVPVREVERAAGAPPSYGPFQLTEDAARLTPAQRRAVKHVVEAMLEPAAAAAAQDGGTVTPLRPRQAQSGQSGRAARKVPGGSRGRAKRAELDRQAETPPPIPEDEP